MKLKAILIFFATLFGLAILASAALYLEDQQYEAYEFQGVKEEKRKAILMTWLSPKAEDGWQGYRSQLAARLQELHESGEVVLLLPMEHPPLKHPEQKAEWSHLVLILLRAEAPVAKIAEELLASAQSQELSASLRSVDILRLQSGLDLFYPKYDGLAKEAKLEQSVEYVFSQPEARKDYYQIQYVYSGPAMADLHQRDKAGRFIGFELMERKYGAKDMPEWDLVHIFGFTPWQSMKASPFFMSTWDKHARRVFGPEASFKSVMQRWNKIRLKVQQSVQQNQDLTLQARS